MSPPSTRKLGSVLACILTKTNTTAFVYFLLVSLPQILIILVSFKTSSNVFVSHTDVYSLCLFVLYKSTWSAFIPLKRLIRTLVSTCTWLAFTAPGGSTAIIFSWISYFPWIIQLSFIVCTERSCSSILMLLWAGGWLRAHDARVERSARLQGEDACRQLQPELDLESISGKRNAKETTFPHVCVSVAIFMS